MCKKSGFFKKICESNTWKESSERIVMLHDDQVHAFARLLQFVYHGRYCYQSDSGTGTRKEKITTIDDLLASGVKQLTSAEALQVASAKRDFIMPAVDLEVYTLADKYDIPSLKTLSLQRCVLNSCLTCGITSLFAAHYPNRANQDPELKEAIADFIATKFHLIRHNEKEWTNGVERWLKEDFELCRMVMDRLSEQKGP